MPQDTTPKTLRLIVGCYTKSLPHVEAKGEGISFVDVDTRSGEFRQVSVHTGIGNPSYVSYDADRGLLYAVEELPEQDASLVVYRADPGMASLEYLAKVPAHGDWPCHIGFDSPRNRVFLSNYESGSFVVWPLDNDGLPGGKATVIQRSGQGANPERQEGPHVHFGVETPDGRHVLVCDAGTDEISAYPLTGESGIAMEADNVLEAPPGSLPRHVDFSIDGKRFFVVSELGNLISTYAWSPESIELLGHVSTLPEDNTRESASAAVRVHPNGRFLYSSNRGHDSIAIFDISNPERLPKLIGTHPTSGNTPREFAIDASGQFMVVANQDSHNLVLLGIDSVGGTLSTIGNGFSTGSPVCVALL